MKTKSFTRVFLLSLLILAVALMTLAVSPFMRAGTEGEDIAQAEALPTISTGNVEVLRGKYFTVDIILSNNTLGLTSLKISLDYDPTVMTLVKYDTKNNYLRGSAMPASGYGLVSSNFTTSGGGSIHPVDFLWNGTDPDYSNGTLLTLRFKSITSSDPALLGKHFFTLTYDQSNTFRTTPKDEGGHIIYQQVNLAPGFVDVTAGKFQCTYYDWDGSEIVHYEENDFSLFIPEEPAHPSRASTRTHYYTYEEDQWDTENPWTENMEEPESIKWDITALYKEYPQPYTVYYYFGEMDPETGVLDIQETPEYYYYTLDGEDKVYCTPKNLSYDASLPVLAQYTEAYYSHSAWYVDKDCTEELTVGLVPEDTSVDAAMVAASPRGVPLENTFKLNLYAYRTFNEDIIQPEELEVTASKLENEVIVEGTTVTVNLNLTKNFGIMSATLTLDYDNSCLTLTNLTPGTAFKNVAAFSCTNNEYSPAGYSTVPFILSWSSSTGNFYTTGTLATLTFTLDPNASIGDHLVTVTYTPKQDVTRYYDETTISGKPDPGMLWYTNINIVDGYVSFVEVDKPTAHVGNYTFNQAEQTYTFADDGDSDQYDIVTSNTRRNHGSQTVTVSLKSGDNVYRFWKESGSRPRADLDFDFEILRRSVAIPTASSVIYYYNHEPQTYVFDDAGDSAYYNATDTFTRTSHGTQNIVCSLKEPDESYWGSDSSDVTNKSYPFTIERLRVAKPVSAGLTYTYNTQEQTYQFTSYGGSNCYKMTAGSDKRTASGSQIFTYSLDDTDNYCWDEEGDPTASITFTFKILKRSITAPSETAATYIYTGKEKTYLFSAEPQEDKELYYSVSDDKRTIAGSQQVTVTLLHKDDTYWGADEEDTEDKKYLFTVEKQAVVPPTASTQALIFNVVVNGLTFEPKSQKYSFSKEEGDPTLYTVDDAACSKSASGTTFITVSLKDKANYKWSEPQAGESEDLSYPFTIEKRAVTVPTENSAFTESYVYKNADITFALTNVEQMYVTITNRTRQDAGIYTGDDAVKIDLTYPDDTYWAGSDPRSTETISYDFKIAPKPITKPTKHNDQSDPYVYDGGEKTYTFASGFDGELMTASNLTRTVAGEQTVTVSLNSTNYAWKEDIDYSLDDLKYTFTIEKAPVVKPTADETAFQFDGTAKTYVFGNTVDSARYNLPNEAELTSSQSGTTTLTVSLKDGDNYCWKNTDSSDDLTFPFTIAKKPITKPTAHDDEHDPYVYNGEEQTYTFATPGDTDWFTSSDTTRTNAGSQTVTVALNDKVNTYWKGTEESAADLEFTFTIEKQAVEVIQIDPKQYNSTLQTSGLENASVYTVVSDEGGITVEDGPYPVTVKLTTYMDSDEEKCNYKWSDGDETFERTFYFEIKPTANSWLSAPSALGWTYVYGQAGIPATAEATYGTVAITYRNTDDPNSEYGPDLPVNAGNYAARFFVEETPSYSGFNVTKPFKVEKATLDMDNVAWQEEVVFTYNQGEHSVLVTGLPTEFTDRPEVFYPEYSDNVKVNRGDYTASVVFHYDTVNYKLSKVFADECGFTINPCLVTIVWSTNAPYVFTGVSFVFPTATYVDLSENTIDNISISETEGQAFKNYGSYRFKAEIDNPNYAPKDDSEYIDIEVQKKPITKPTAHDDKQYPFIYSGVEQTYTFASGFDANWMTASNDKRTEVGSQFVTVILNDTANTYWAGTEESVAPLTNYKFTIDKKQVEKPTASTETYIYNGGEQTYTFASAGGAGLYETSDCTLILASSKVISVSLIDPANYRWVGGDSEPLEFTFTIDKRPIEKPNADETEYVYDGTLKTYTFATPGDSAWFLPKNTTRTNAGSQTVTVMLNDKDNTYWKDTEEVTEDLPFLFSIKKAQVRKPTADPTPFLYNGNEQTYVLGNNDDEEYYSKSGTMTKILAGSNDVTVSLNDPSNYRWKDGDSEPLLFTFVIAKIAVTAPTADTTKYVYDGAEKTYTFKTAGDVAYFDPSNLKRTDAGEQTVTVVLKDKFNTYWKGTADSALDLTFTFKIAKAEVTAPVKSAKSYVYTGAEQTYTFATEGDAALWSASTLTSTEAGSFDITVSLISPLNYRWKGTDSSAPLTFTFTIDPAKVTKPQKDETKFYCNGGEQTYQVESSALYTVTGATKKEQGTTNVVIALKDKRNYVWDNGFLPATTEDLSYPFMIEHDFKNKYNLEDYRARKADCTHAEAYYFVCDCGAVGRETYEVGEPLGHDYSVLFDWGEPETVDGADSYSVVYANVTCSRCDHKDRLLADLTVDVTPPGQSNGLKVFTASVTLDRTYTDTKEVVLKAIYHNYGEPEWQWSTDSTGAPVVLAVFTCTDVGAENLSIEVSAEVEIVDNGDDSFKYVATALFYGKPYTDSKVKSKPALTFISGSQAADIVTYYLLPGENATPYIPAVPTKADAVFLKWWEEDNAISLVYGSNGYTPFVMRDADRTFVALWKSVGQITVSVSDLEDKSFVGCVVELKQGENTIDTILTDEDGKVSFSGLDYGNYSIVVTYTDGTSVTYTTGTVLGESEKTVPVKMSEKRFNTEIKDTDNKNISVQNLENTVPDEDKEQIVTAGEKGDVTEITVVLSVVNETDEAVVKTMTELIESQDNTVVDLSDITLVKTVKIINEKGEEDPSESVLPSSDVLVDITFPLTEEIYNALAAVHGSVENVVVARKDGDSVEFMIKYSEDVALDTDEECFYVTEEDGVPYIVVRTRTFSTTYGLCVNGSSVVSENKFITFEVSDWTYGETPIPATATSLYGDPIIYYQVNGEWVTEVPTSAGTYNVKAVVEETSEYKGIETGAQITIAKAKYTINISFEDLTVVYDGEVHSIIAEGLPEGVTVNYENNGQVDVGDYVVTVYFVCDPNYEQIPPMTATLHIVEGKKSVCCIFFWILLAIAIVEIILLILLFIRGKKYKKKYLEAKDEKESMASAMLLLGIGSLNCRILNIIFLVLDIILLGLIIWNTILNRKYKKKYEEVVKEIEEKKEAQSKEEPKEGEEGEAPSSDGGEEPPAQE